MTIKQHLFNGYSVAGETRDFYIAMQNLNRATIKYAAGMIKVGMKLPDVKALCENYLLENGADSFWYWNVGAFVFAGDETAVSVSGKRRTGFTWMERKEGIGKNKLPDTYRCNQSQSHSAGTHTTADFSYICIIGGCAEYGIIWHGSEAMAG